MKKITFLILLSMFLITGCQNSNDELINVSIINLIANPEKYHNKDVTVIGVGNLEFEGNKICLSNNDLEYHVINNCLWITLNQEVSENEVESLNGKYIIIEGTFDMEYTGHLGMYSGAIVDITRYELWEDRFKEN